MLQSGQAACLFSRAWDIVSDSPNQEPGVPKELRTAYDQGEIFGVQVLEIGIFLVFGIWVLELFKV